MVEVAPRSGVVATFSAAYFGCALLCTMGRGSSACSLFFYLFLFLLSVIGSAGFGYWLNDWTDIAEDRLAGKPNAAAGFHFWQNAGVLALLFLLGWLPWLWLPATPYAWIALALLFLNFVLYSVPPFRFKHRAWLGVLCDIHYGHVLPILIAVATFLKNHFTTTEKMLPVLSCLLLTLYISGGRNIIEHQIQDRQHDRKTKTQTLVQRISPMKAAFILSYLLVPLEIIVLFLLLIQISKTLSISYIIFLLLYIFLFWRWGVFWYAARYWLFKAWYMNNDFYEGWLPLTILLCATLHYPAYGGILVFHLILFPKSLQILHWLFREVYAIFFVKS